jgi:uncharacterized protein YggE
VVRVAPAAKDAFSATRNGVEAVKESLRRNQIPAESVEVSRVAVTTAYEGYDTPKFIGYRARVSFRVIIDQLGLVEAVLSDAVTAGANEVSSVRYLTSQLRELRAQARREAVLAARRKAEVYCDAAGVGLGHVLHIEDVNPDTIGMRGGYAESVDIDVHDEETTSGALKSGSLVISAAVTVAWSILNE